MLLAVLAFLVYLAERRWSALVVPRVAAGLASLTRSPALFLAPLTLLLAGLDWVTLEVGLRETRLLARLLCSAIW